jgi:hypothetical protein
MVEIYHINGAIVSASAFLGRKSLLDFNWSGGQVSEFDYSCGNCTSEPVIETRTISYVNRHDGTVPFDYYYGYCSAVGRSIEGIQAWVRNQTGYVPGSIELIDPYPGLIGRSRPPSGYVEFPGGCGHSYTGSPNYPVYDLWVCRYQIAVS